MKRCWRIECDVTFDDDRTDEESVATAMDILMKTALSTPGILDDYGPVEIGEFFPTTEMGRASE